MLAVGIGVARPRIDAQEAITLVADTPRNEFPAGVTFTVSFSAASPPEEVRLRYELAPDGTGASGVANCISANTHNCTFTLTSGRGIFVIPGAEITYHWEIEDEDGNKLSTPEKVYIHEDTRFDFRTVSDGNVTVYFHAGTEAEAPAVLTAAVESLDRVGTLENAQVTFPVKVFLYETADEMQPAIGAAGGRGVQILGEVVYSDTAMVSADVDALDITRHEVAHIVTREATRGPYGIPGWLNEGISVYSQREPLSGHGAALDAAIRADRVLTMKELNSSATGSVASTVGLYYGQAGSIVRYLVETYGEAKFADLMRTFKDGSTIDKAFQTVYQLDQLGVENAWRDSVGLDARIEVATPVPAPTEQASEEVTPGVDPGTSVVSHGDDDGFPFVTVVIIGALMLAVAGAALVAVRVFRERV